MATHVAIATTQGPVFIQEITEEEPGVSPMVCLNGTSKQLAISNAYGDFVKKGSGLIERTFGSASWRMDVSSTIDAGDSWQLGVYMAHMLHQENRLGKGVISDGDEVILVTGAVKYSGEVTPVKHIPEKMRAASAQVDAWQNQGATITLLMHPENLAVAISAAISPGEQNAISHVHELTGGKPTAGHRSFALPTALFALVIIAGTLFFVTEQGKETPFYPPAEKEPGSSQVSSAQLEILTAAEPFLCQTGKMRQAIQTSGGDGYFQTTAMTTLCSIYLRTNTAGKKQASLYALDSGAMVALAPVTGAERTGWQIPLPLNRGKPRSYVLIVARDRLPPGDQAKLKSNLDELRPFGTDPIREVNAILNDMSLEAEVFGHTLR